MNSFELVILSLLLSPVSAVFFYMVLERKVLPLFDRKDKWFIRICYVGSIVSAALVLQIQMQLVLEKYLAGHNAFIWSCIYTFIYGVIMFPIGYLVGITYSRFVRPYWKNI